VLECPFHLGSHHDVRLGGRGNKKKKEKDMVALVLKWDPLYNISRNIGVMKAPPEKTKVRANRLFGLSPPIPSIVNETEIIPFTERGKRSAGPLPHRDCGLVVRYQGQSPPLIAADK